MLMEQDQLKAPGVQIPGLTQLLWLAWESQARGTDYQKFQNTPNHNPFGVVGNWLNLRRASLWVKFSERMMKGVWCLLLSLDMLNGGSFLLPQVLKWNNDVYWALVFIVTICYLPWQKALQIWLSRGSWDGEVTLVMQADPIWAWGSLMEGGRGVRVREVVQTDTEAEEFLWARFNPRLLALGRGGGRKPMSVGSF